MTCYYYKSYHGNFQLTELSSKNVISYKCGEGKDFWFLIFFSIICNLEMKRISEMVFLNCSFNNKQMHFNDHNRYYIKNTYNKVRLVHCSVKNRLIESHMLLYLVLRYI